MCKTTGLGTQQPPLRMPPPYAGSWDSPPTWIAIHRNGYLVTSGETCVGLPILTIQKPGPSWKVKAKLREWWIV